MLGIDLLERRCRNIILGQEVTRWRPFLDLRQAAQHIRQLAAQYHLEINPQVLIQDLPVGLRQRSIYIWENPKSSIKPRNFENRAYGFLQTT